MNLNVMANHVIVTTPLVIAKMDPLSLIVQVCNDNYKVFLILNPRFLLCKPYYRLDTLKGHQSKFVIVNGETFRNCFISLTAYSLIIWVMRPPKNFEKIAILKIFFTVKSCKDKKKTKKCLKWKKKGKCSKTKIAKKCKKTCNLC